MNTCYDYIWSDTQGYICNNSVAEHHSLLILLALLLIFGVLSFLAVLRVMSAQVRIIDLLRTLIEILRPVTGFQILQLVGDKFMAVNGTPLGSQSTFTETPLPAGSALPAGVVPVWTVGDTNVTLTPSADGTSCVAAVAASDTNPSYVLTVTAALPGGATISGQATVPILPALPTSLEINQVA